MIQSPFDRPTNAFLQIDDRGITEAISSLSTIIVTSHGRVFDVLSSERRTTTEESHDELERGREEEAKGERDPIDVVDLAGVTGEVPDKSRHVPEIDGAIVGDEKSLAVDAVVVTMERRSVRLTAASHERRGELDVGVRDVADVGEVEEVIVHAQLEGRRLGSQDLDHGRDLLDVTFADHARWSNGGGQHLLILVLSIGGQHEHFRFRLEISIMMGKD